MTSERKALVPIEPITETHGLGPAMIALNPQQRAFVLAYVETGGQDQTRAAVLSGYGVTPGSQKVAGYRLAHDPKILAAIKEVADQRLRSGALLGAEVLIAIAQNPVHKDQLKAATELLNRGGLIVRQEVEHIHRSETEAEQVKKIVSLARELGLDPKQLLGSAGVTVDADFKVVSNGKGQPQPEPEEPEEVDAEFEPAASAAGLEDLLYGS